MNELVRKRILALIVCTAWVIGLAPAHATSFDCVQARSVFERMVCGDERLDESLQLGEDLRKELLKLDEELNAVYGEVLSKHFDPELLKREQRAWLAARERCTREMNVPCNVFHLYRDRIDNLRYDLTHPPRTEADREAARLLSMGSPPGDNFAISRQATFKGYGMEICEALVRWFNHRTPKGTMECSRCVVRSMPGIREPAWQKLDTPQHEGLFAKIIEAGITDPGEKGRPEIIRKRLEAARTQGYKLWMLKEDVYQSHRKGKPETMVLYALNMKNFRGELSLEEQERMWGSEWLVTDDLREVDKEPHNHAFGVLNYGQLLYYKGKPFYIGASSTAFITSSRYSGTFCNIDNFGAKPGRRQK